MRFVAFAYKNRKITAIPTTKAAKRAVAVRNNPFSMRMYVLRNKSSYIALEDLRLAESEEQEYEIPLSSTYVSGILSSLQWDDARFVNTAKNDEIQLVKHSVTSGSGSSGPSSESDSDDDRMGEAQWKSEQRKQARKARAAKTKSDESSSSSSSSSKDTGDVDPGREERLARARREAAVRERMEAEGRSLLFDEDDEEEGEVGSDSGDGNGSEEGLYDDEIDEAAGFDGGASGRAGEGDVPFADDPLESTRQNRGPIHAQEVSQDDEEFIDLD
jgi:hypothetical protein